jgi:penicillin V acylase-like amidase (Ntn superfamily)
MKNSRLKHFLLSILILFTLENTAIMPTSACTRVVYLGSDGVVITGRSMDWVEDMQSNLWLFPRGIKRDGAAGAESTKWISKFGSLAVSSYEAGTADGMNEKGLVANVLYLVESDYGKITSSKPKLSIALWAQYVLDNFATVNEVVETLRGEPFQIVAPILPNGAPAQLHLAVSDTTGDSAIFEYIDGKLVIHHGEQYQVMTNSPKFDDQLALNKYWASVGGQTFLPGTSRAADRFARASFFIDTIPKKSDLRYIKEVPKGIYENQAIASVMSVMRSVSVPLGISTPGQPNISSTIWRTIADNKNKIYYFDSATSPNTFWISLSKLDFKESAPVKKLTTAGGNVYAGDASSKFKIAEPFAFLPANPN